MPAERKISRRDFIHHSAAGLVATSAAGAIGGYPGNHAAMPTRMLGATGMHISLLTFGGGSQFLQNGDGAWEPMLERAVEQGLNYFDTSSSYQWESSLSSEERYGAVLAPMRDRIFLATKFDSRDPDDAMREFDRSLRRLKTDHVDVLLIHSIGPGDDVAKLEKGVYPMLRRIKDEGSARFIGVSSMDSAERCREVITKLELDVALLAMNPTGYGGFVKDVLPVARAKNMGVIAMKVMRDIVGKPASPGELMRYALSQDGVAGALIGHHGMSVLQENIEIVRDIGADPDRGMGLAERRHLELRLAGLAGPHALCWARPGYRDGMLT